MSKFLIFRTDRIGDFIFSRMLTESIKLKYPNSRIDIVCSKYNSTYIRNFKDIKKIFILDKYNLKMLFKNLLIINNLNYDYLIILDGKRRSIFYSVLLKAKKKYVILKDFRPSLLLKIFFNKYFVNSESNSQYNNFTAIINYLNLKVPNQINYYNDYKFKNVRKKPNSNFTLLHLDEKWFEGFYHNDYKYMSLNYKNFDLLIKSIFKKFNKKIILTSGNIKINNFDTIIEKNFFKNKEDIFISKKYKNRLIYFQNTSFRDLEKIVKNSSSIVCCEGAISHVSNAFNIKTIALINKLSLKTAIYWTKHMKNIRLVYRDNIKSVCKQINNVKF